MRQDDLEIRLFSRRQTWLKSLSQEVESRTRDCREVPKGAGARAYILQFQMHKHVDMMAYPSLGGDSQSINY